MPEPDAHANQTYLGPAGKLKASKSSLPKNLNQADRTIRKGKRRVK